MEWDTNTAEVIYEPEHEHLENTIESMEVAFSYGADVVELDIQRTKDILQMVASLILLEEKGLV